MIDLRKQPPEKWRAASIPKKDGSVRYLLIPCDELKEVQHDILDYLYHNRNLKPFFNAVGFVPFKNTLTGARIHNKLSPLIIQLDIHNFFPTFPIYSVRQALTQAKVPAVYIDYILRYCVFRGKKKEQLPQGAPTSPYLTNLGMFETDKKLKGIAAAFGYTYSRYADDMCFAVEKPGDTEAVEKGKALFKAVETTLDKCLDLKLSYKKTMFSYLNSPRVPRRITGITVRKDGKGYNAPKFTRKKARIQCHLLWKRLQDGVPADDLIGDYKSLMGLIGYCDYVRSKSNDGYDFADPVINSEKFNYIQEVFSCKQIL